MQHHPDVTSWPPEIESLALASETASIAGFKAGAVQFDLSTVSATLICQVQAEFNKNDVHLLDAPVSGGRKRRAASKLAIQVGGDKTIFDANRAPLDAMGELVKYIGEIGAKVVSMLFHNSAGFVDFFAVAVKAGVERLVLQDTIRQGTGGRVRTFD